MRLSRNEKIILTHYDREKDAFTRPDTLSDREYAGALYLLQEKGILKARHPLPEKWEVEITDLGRLFLTGNPKLRNPFDWEQAMRYVTIATLIAALLALVVGCVRLLHP